MSKAVDLALEDGASHTRSNSIHGWLGVWVCERMGDAMYTPGWNHVSVSNPSDCIMPRPYPSKLEPDPSQGGERDSET